MIVFYNMTHHPEKEIQRKRAFERRVRLAVAHSVVHDTVTLLSQKFSHAYKFLALAFRNFRPKFGAVKLEVVTWKSEVVFSYSQLFLPCRYRLFSHNVVTMENQCNWMATLINFILISLDLKNNCTCSCIVHWHDSFISRGIKMVSMWPSNCTGFHGHHVEKRVYWELFLLGDFPYKYSAYRL